MVCVSGFGFLSLGLLFLWVGDFGFRQLYGFSDVGCFGILGLYLGLDLWCLHLEVTLPGFVGWSLLIWFL